MVTVRVEGGSAIFEVEAGHRLWALKSRIEVPMSPIWRVYAEPNPPMGWLDGLKMMGTDLPHYFRAGTFWLQRNGSMIVFPAHVKRPPEHSRLRRPFYCQAAWPQTVQSKFP